MILAHQGAAQCQPQSRTGRSRRQRLSAHVDGLIRMSGRHQDRTEFFPSGVIARCENQDLAELLERPAGLLLVRERQSEHVMPSAVVRILFDEHLRLADAFVLAAGDRQEIGQGESHLLVSRFAAQPLLQEVSQKLRRFEVLSFRAERPSLRDRGRDRRPRDPE